MSGLIEGNGNGERRRLNWPIIVALLGLTASGLIAWGSTTAKVDDHSKRIETLETNSLNNKDLNALNQRLGRIESQLDQLLQQRRAQRTD